MPYKDPENRREHRRKAPIDQKRDKHLRYKYGISVGEYQRLHNAQEGLCGICRNHTEILDVDHDHETGEVRGLLCRRCNQGIGLLGESIETLHSAIDYLECHAIDRRMVEFRKEAELCQK